MPVLASQKVVSLAGYEYRSDFIAYFLQSPVTKEPEYEIRIKASKESAAEYRNLLKKGNIQYRQIGLEIFPPPIRLLLDYSSLKDALNALVAWYASNKEKEAFKVSILKPTGDLTEVQSEQDIQKIIETMPKA